MIDIHTHLLPGVDDGSEDMDMSLELLDMAARSGVEGIVATPHCNIPDEFDNYVSPQLDALFRKLDEAREEAGIPLKLCRGMEVFATWELPELLREGRVWTLNDTRYFLMEFAFSEDPDYCRRILRACEVRKSLCSNSSISCRRKLLCIRSTPLCSSTADRFRSSQ